MVEQTDYGRGFRDGIKDTTRRLEEARKYFYDAGFEAGKKFVKLGADD